MATNFVCPHCGRNTSTDREDVEWVDFDNGTSDALFPALPDGEERHIDQRLCCPDCHARTVGGKDGLRRRAVLEAAGEAVPLHPYDPQTHHNRLVAVDQAEAAKRGVSSHGRFKE